MSLNTQPYKGTRDFYPEDKRKQKYMFGVLRDVVESFGYHEYDAPLIEPFEIYAAKTGDEIVNQQLYSFEDRGGRKVAIRPEMTPSVSRMVAARRQELAYPLRWYSIPNLWRYERPQRGRLREHWQLNVDIFGVEDIEADFEIIQVADSILKVFGAKPDNYKIRVNSLKAAASVYKDLKLNNEQHVIVSKLLDKRSKISEDEFNEALDNAVGEKVAASLRKYWTEEKPPENIAKLLKLLEKEQITNAVFDPEIVRGFDYYTDIVFEVYDNSAENNRSMFGGGRYDGLVGAFGVEPVPTVGFGMGDVTLQNFLEANKLIPKLEPETNVVAILIGDVYEPAQKVMSELRSQGLNVAVDSTNRNLDAKIKSAAKGGIKYALFIGEQELATGKYKLKNLETGQELEIAGDEIVKNLKPEK
ncbi:histidine--tRNA ligase [Candidatus Saccharibacteria bacterium]|nr:histidine--tRNA ligase [Candidatus Saccharibacteria bacterium]